MTGAGTWADTLGLLRLLFLSSYALVAAFAVAVRMRYASRAETLLATLLFWNALVLLPIHLLGLTDGLTARHLGMASFATSSAALAASFVGAGSAWNHAVWVRSAFLDVLGLSAQAVRQSLRARSFVVIGVVAVLVIVPWTAWLSYLAPSDSWDGMWYHETMVGYAIQNHGYAPAALPLNLTQQANGYPRNCEMTNLWFVIFSDRKLLEVPQSLMAVALVLATYLIARRLTDDRITAMGLGCALLLMPGAVLELRSTYIDLHVATFLMAALHFATRPKMRVRDGWVAGVALALLTGAKSMALAWVPPLALFAAVRLVAQRWRDRRAAAIAAIVGCALLIAATGALTYVRNWILFHNPLWPIAYDNERHHIHWPGVVALGWMDWNRPLQDVYAEMASVPVPGKDFADTRVYGYGLAVPYLLLPLGAVLGLALLVAAVWSFGRRFVLRLPDGTNDWRTRHMFVLAAILLYTAYLSPALWQARYNIHLVAGLLLLVAWASSFVRSSRFGDAVASFTIASFLLNLWWAQPGWGLDVRSAIDFAKLSPAERATHAPAEWAISDEVAEARERELGPGSVVAFTDDCTFPGPLWNEHFTNRLEFVPSALGLQGARERLDEIHAQWFVVGSASPLYSLARAHPEQWQEIGLASRGFPTVAFRRVGGQPPS